MSIVKQLKSQINSNKIIFDDNSDELKDQLLGNNAGQLISEKLQDTILFMSQIVSSHIRISSIVRNNTSPSHHAKRKAVDIGNEEIANEVLSILSNHINVELYNIDEIIFDAGGEVMISRNRYNDNEGEAHEYNDSILKKHRDHIHISVTE